ncbi:MAG: pentapeptide repeat-containing protein [Nitrospirae bacterium]|nr:pentapeptide repeat-containing protein [Nitrospirota bacterium]MBF0591977.1 pentapeptide repeat-containing protein [Nitrospirota bacterium]
MLDGISGVVVTRPGSIWDKPLKVNFKEFLKALSRGIVDAVTLQNGQVATEVINAVAAVGFKTEPGELAFQLISRSITKAAIELLGKSVGQQLAAAQVNYNGVLNQIGEAIASKEVYIDKRFMDRPAELPVLKDLQGVIKQWLVGCGLAINKVQSIVNRLPMYFVRALDQEWRKNEETYRPIMGSLEGPFRKAIDRELAWGKYANLLRSYAEEKVFDEPFGLNQLYIALNAYYVEGDSRQNQRRVVVDLKEEITRWLHNTDKRDAIRIISGGPGSGKSTFAKIFAARLAHEGPAKVIYVPLHLIDATKDLAEEISRFVKADRILVQNPLDLDCPEPNLLVILDGLDELASQGQAAAETARAFVREVERTVERHNHTEFCLRILISGRELVVQDNETEFRHKRQIITLLPYFISDEDRKKEDYNDPKGILQQDLRNSWWRNYGSLTAKGYPTMPVELQRRDLDEITAQPLLNYLLALSYTRGKINFSQAVNLNSIYSDLITAVHERKYGNRPFPMDIKDFTRVLEEVGLAAWQSSDGRTTTVRAIETLCKDSGLDKQLKYFMTEAEAGVTRLLAAFFFRQSGQNECGDKTFVFTHKSFGEYLTVCRIVRAMEKINCQMRRQDVDPEDGWSEREALRHWAQICGPSVISPYIYTFLLNEVLLLPIEEVQSWQGCFTKLFSYALMHGMPMELLITRVNTFSQMLFQSRNAEEALLVALNACARMTLKVSAIEHPTSETFGTWFRRVKGQLKRFENVLAARCLSFLNLKGVNLILADLTNTHFTATDLTNADLTGANLTGADLRGANLSRADLTNAHFTGANLTCVNLTGANLTGADLRGANLTNANLKDAHFTGANLTCANLTDTNLTGADLTGANLKGANLTNANLKDADLKGANLTNAHFTDADLRGAHLTDTDLIYADLTDANLTGNSLRDANRG